MRVRVRIGPGFGVGPGGRGLRAPVRGAAAAVRAASGDHPVHLVAQIRDVPFVPTVRAPPQQPADERQSEGLALGVPERAEHRRDERVRPVPSERAEVVAESGASDGLQGQLGHVGGDIDRASALSAAPAVPGVAAAGRPRVRVPVPGREQLVGRGQHGGVVALQGGAGEAGRENVVRQLPVGLPAVRGEQPVAGDGTQMPYAQPDVLGEPLLVRQLGHQLWIADENGLPAQELPREDRPQLAPEPDRVLERRARADPAHVTEQRNPARRVGYPAEIHDLRPLVPVRSLAAY